MHVFFCLRVRSEVSRCHRNRSKTLYFHNFKNIEISHLNSNEICIDTRLNDSKVLKCGGGGGLSFGSMYTLISPNEVQFSIYYTVRVLLSIRY